MNATELTPHQRIEILEDILKKLESGDTYGGLCYKITVSANELFEICEISVKKIIPLFTLKNAKKVTEVKYRAVECGHWWEKFDFYDFENRIKFVKWLIEQERINILNL